MSSQEQIPTLMKQALDQLFQLKAPLAIGYYDQVISIDHTLVISSNKKTHVFKSKN